MGAAYVQVFIVIYFVLTENLMDNKPIFVDGFDPIHQLPDLCRSMD